MAMLVYQRVESFELPPKLYCPKMEYRFFLRFKGSPSFYKGFDQTFTDIRAISRSHHFELMAAAMAKVIKTVPGCARISAVTRRSDAGARRSNSGSASSRSRSSSSGVAVAVAGAVAVAVAEAAAVAVAAAVAAASDSRTGQQRQQWQQVTAAATSSYQHHTSTISSSCISSSCISSSSNRGDAGAVGALLVLVRQMPAAKAQLGPAVAMVVVAVVAGWGRRFACSWPGSCQAACREFCLRFCLRFGFVPERKTRRENETAGWKEYLHAESRNLTKCKCSRRKNKIGKKNGTNRKKRRRKGSQQKLSQERHESKKGNKRKTRENR